MCGRYTLATQLDLLVDRFAVQKTDLSYNARFNIAPTQDAPVIIEEDQRILTAMRWGLVPFWAKDESIGNKMINARAETLAEKPSFRTALERRRCIVPVDGFYEWRKAKSGKGKVPLRFVLGDGEPFGLAGLWDVWKDADGNQLRTFTIITTDANDLVRPMHDRMPAILRPKDEAKWLDPEEEDVQAVLPLLQPFDPKKMHAYEVSSLVNSPGNDSPACIAPVEG